MNAAFILSSRTRAFKHHGKKWFQVPGFCPRVFEPGPASRLTAFWFAVVPGTIVDMGNVTYFIRRAFCRMSLAVGIFCFVEICFHVTEGTKPNFRFPWGHYVASVAVMGTVLLFFSWLTWIPADPHRYVVGPSKHDDLD